ncbi:polysaccharide biosynthesis/export family protein [Salinispira pacifica]|uniref:Polysaccharide export protein n=1 Tax=Salinispira pacifica TaxID=1307761 RepID=V5WLA7_9SPIO|nr:SLBB domain-containing protein [Salinispira pacifica]AHC16498.1 polysaccharide export protein [Salinispira pacifica]
MKATQSIFTTAIFFLFICLGGIAFAQDSPNPDRSAAAEEATADNSRIQRAEVSPLYRVSPGDEYLLYVGNQNNTQLPLSVESDYSVRLAFLGTLDAAGLSYAQFREQVYALVKESYPQSIPRMRIRNLGRFEVSFSGELSNAGTTLADGLTPLSEVLTSRLTSFSDTRNISIRRNDGSSLTVDYFMFSRTGERKHNPYLHYGDRIEVERAQRIVQIDGQVFRPGRYVLTEKDSLTDIIQEYADGLRHNADRTQISIFHLNGSSETVDIRREEKDNNIHIDHLSRIFVPPAHSTSQSMQLEGTASMETIGWIQVTGDVQTPGKIPFSSWNRPEQYINQAGPQGRYRYSVYSQNGEKKSNRAPLAPMDTIVVQQRPAQWFMNSWLAPTVSLATGILTLISMILNF